MTRIFIPIITFFAAIIIFSSCKKSDTQSPPAVVQNQSFTVKGRLKTCAGADVSSGLIVVLTYRDKISYEYFFDSVHTGSFALSIQPVGKVDSIAVFGVDLTNLKLSDTFRYKLLDTLVNINVVPVCTSNIAEYFRYKVDNRTEQVYTPLIGDSLNLMSWDYPGGWPMTSFQRQCYYNCKTIEFQFDGYSVGTFAVTGRNRIFISPWYSFNMPNTGNITYSSYGAIGQYVTGTLNVPFIDNTDSLNHVLTGSFKLKRKNHL